MGKGKQNKNMSKGRPAQPYFNGPQIGTNNAMVIEQKFFALNYSALEKRYPELALKIKDTAITDYEIIWKDGLPNLKIKKDGTTYYDLESPPKDVIKQLEELKLKNARMALFLGYGLGYELMFFIQKMAQAQNTNHILVVEKDLQVFKAAMRCSNIVEMIEHPSIKFLVGLPETLLNHEFQQYIFEGGKHFFLKAVKPVYHMTAFRLNKDYYMNSLRNFREACTYQILNYGNDPKDSLIGIEHMLDNLQEILENPGVNMLYNKLSGCPAVVISAGPSLNKNKHLLQGLQDKALLICPDTSLKILVDMGIHPHLVTSLERTDKTVPLLDCFAPEEVEDVYLAACPVIPHEAYEKYPGPKVVVYRNFDHFKWLGIDKGILEIKKSSGNMAFKVADALGCDPIILIGQDLAFGEEGETHAAGTAREKSAEEIKRQEDFYNKQQRIPVPGTLGGTVMTNPTWYGFLRTYELDIIDYKGTCINSTEGGANINGTIVMPFSQSIEKYINKEIYPVDRIREATASFSADWIEQDEHKVAELMDQTVDDINLIIGYCTQGVDLYTKYREELESWLRDPVLLQDNLDRLKVIEQEMGAPKAEARKLHKTFQQFLTHVFQSFHIQFEMDMIALPEKYDDPNQAQVEITLRQAEWYATIGDISAICRQSLLKARDRLKAKLAENTGGGM